MIAETNRVERAAMLTRLFIIEGELSTDKAVELCGVSLRTIQRDFATLARVLPIYPDYSGRWLYESGEHPAKISEY